MSPRFPTLPPPSESGPSTHFCTSDSMACVPSEVPLPTPGLPQLLVEVYPCCHEVQPGHLGGPWLACLLFCLTLSGGSAVVWCVSLRGSAVVSPCRAVLWCLTAGQCCGVSHCGAVQTYAGLLCILLKGDMLTGSVSATTKQAPE